MVLRLENMRLAKGSFDLRADVEISKGERVAVSGPSGAGKSTLFDGIAGFLRPESGRIVWDGEVLNRHSPGERPVAMLFQDNNLFPHLTVGQNIELAFHGRKIAGERRSEQVKNTLNRVGLDGYERRKISQLSGGQLSRVALARLLLQDRPLWLLDEPFAALGPGLKREMIAHVSVVAEESGATVLMITHAPSDAEQFSNMSLFVADGVVSGPIETILLLNDPPPSLVDYFGS